MPSNKKSLLSLFESSEDRFTALGPPPESEVLGVLAKTSDGRNILRQNEVYTEHSDGEVNTWKLVEPKDKSGFQFVRTVTTNTD